MKWEEFCTGFKRTVYHAADKLTQGTDIAGLQLKLNGAERRLCEAYEALGKAIYPQVRKDAITPSEELNKAIVDVDSAQAEVTDLTEQIRKAKEAAEEYDAKVKEEREARKAAKEAEKQAKEQSGEDTDPSGASDQPEQ